MQKNPLQLLIIPLLLALGFHGLSYGDEQVTTDGEELGLLIVGTITNQNIKKNVALVKQTKSGRVKAVKIGFKILEKYVVTSVTSKYITIKSKQKSFLVYQNKFAGEFLGAGTKTSPSNEVSEEGFSRIGDQIRITPDYRDKMLTQDLSKILMQATAVPKIVKGQVVGFKILQIDKGSIYEKAGFRDNDVITSINGIKLNSVSGAVKLLNSVRSAEEVTVGFQRGSEDKNVSMSVSH